ncbi:MAG: hypothetical protein CVU38_21025 [Chloroflexi bacterium HGW-Chloroflexi-1]|nr:MAG: hypothetical protein CVU38_21025 [Chloroflexi bacterium HGW-Chloroflexi-1]
MDTITPADRLRLTAWLIASHLAAAGVTAVLVLRLPLPAGAALAIGAGALAGWLLTAALRRDAEVAALALAQLVAGQPIAALPVPRLSPLAGLLRAIAGLAGRERQVVVLRADLLQRTGETAAQAERNRLARELHDSIKQQLYAINVSAAAALARWDGDATGARAAVEDVRGSAQAALAEMRALLQQLRPAPLATAGLLDALRDQCEALAYRTGAQVTVDFGEPADGLGPPPASTPAVASARTLTPDELPAGAQETVFRIAQEALANVARHARARHVHLRLAREESRLVLEVNDDGQGFDPQGMPAADGAPASPLVVQPAGLGLVNMRERAAAVGGQLQVQSAPGAGSSVRLSLPLVAPAAVVKEVAMSSEVKSLLRTWSAAHTVAGVAAGLGLVFLLGLAPRLAAAGGGPTLSAPLLVSALLTLGAGAVALYVADRSRRAATTLALTLGADSPVLLRAQREADGRQMWITLAGILILPAALLPARMPQFPIPALVASW